MLIHAVNATSTSDTATPRPARVSDARPATPLPAASVPDEAALRASVKAANEALRAVSSTIEFTVEQETGKTIVRVIDQATHEVIRQIPSEELIAIAREIDRLQGLLLKGKA